MKKFICMMLVLTTFALNFGIKVEAATPKDELLNVETNIYLYMDYRKITDETSDQYKYQQYCRTNYVGIRTYKGHLAAALGPYYSTNIGDTYHVVLENGTEFDIFLADCKAMIELEPLGMGAPVINYDFEECLNIIEFVVDEDLVPQKIKSLGTFSGLDIFGGLNGDGGNIEFITRTGHLAIPDENGGEK